MDLHDARQAVVALSGVDRIANIEVTLSSGETLLGLVQTLPLDEGTLLLVLRLNEGGRATVDLLQVARISITYVDGEREVFPS